VDVTDQGNAVTLRAVTSSLPVHPGESMGGPVELPRVWAWQGDTVRIPFADNGYTNHPIHTHNHRFRVVEKDGSRIPEVARFEEDILDMAPVERKTIEFEADADPDIYLMHCHKVSHAMNGDAYPGGMVGGIVYESAMDSDVFAQSMEYAGYGG
jgi:hypothetical protein